MHMMTGNVVNGQKFPYVDMCLPSKSDPTMAAPGKHFMSVFIQYVPFELQMEAGMKKENKNLEIT